MAEYQYRGVDRAGKKVAGRLDSNSEGDLRMTLRGMSIRPTWIAKAGQISGLGKALAATASNQTVPIEALFIFTRQLNVLISAGIPLVQALEVLSDQTADKKLRGMINAIKEKVSSGSYLWESLNQFPKAFPKLYIALIRAGESAGAMDQVLKRLSRYLEDADRLRKMVKGAMMYPIIVTVIGITVVIALLVFVIPKFQSMLEASGQELPMPTMMVINASKFLQSYGIAIGAILGAFGYITLQYVKSDQGRAVLDQLVFRAPIFGTIAQKAGVARFSRTMQTLLSSGVNLIDAIDICRATIDNAVLESAVAKIRTEVESGKTLGTVVGTLPAFPRMAVQMIAVGESTGSLDKMLDKVADFYEAEVEALVTGMTRLIEPLVLVVLGGMVGGMLIAMYLPIFKMAGGVE